jgi:hypothetical protein
MRKDLSKQMKQVITKHREECDNYEHLLQLKDKEVEQYKYEND